MAPLKLTIHFQQIGILFLCFHFHFLILFGETQQIQNDPRDQNAVVNPFYLTSRSDCGDDLKNIFNNEAVIKGYDQQNLGSGPTQCTIRITSASVYPGVQLQILIISMDILDCNTLMSIYDGQGTQKLGSYDCNSNRNINRLRLVTSGDTATFMLSRQNPDNHQYDIEIRVKPFRGGIDPDYDKTNFFSFQKFDQDAIVGMIGGFYGLVVIICLGLIIFFYTRFMGMNKKWETHQLATMKTDTTFDARSQVSQPAWSVSGAAIQRGPTSQFSRSYADTTFSKRGPAPRSDDGSSTVYDHDEKFQQRNLMNQRERPHDRDRMASQNSVYSDDDDPDNFKEKVITPRVKTSGGARWKPKNQRPPSFEEATRDDSSQERSSDEETEESSDADSTRKRLTTTSEEDSETESEETESDASSRSGRKGARSKRHRDKKSKEKSKQRRRRQSSSDEASSQRTDRRTKPQQPTHPQAAGMPYPYPPPPMGGQFVPVMAGHPQFQPLPMVPPNYPPPQYPNAQGQVQPTDPPVYSYLVRRGYTPLDANKAGNSPAGSVGSSQRGGPTFKDEPETRLESGVDYMRR